MNTPSIRTPEEILAETREELEREAALPLPSGAASSEPPKEERGEWTPESVKQLVWEKTGADLLNDVAQAVADAHNAELKAERETITRLQREFENALADTIAEREKREQAERVSQA